MNMTWDSEEQRWKALQSGEIVKNLDLMDASFLSRVEARLTVAGIGTQRSQVVAVMPMTTFSQADAKALYVLG
jgi:hypothetical protein